MTWGRMKKASICVSSRENSNSPTTIASYTPYALQSGASVDSNPVKKILL